MKFLIVAALAVACAHADVSHVVGNDYTASVVKQEVDVNPDSFNYVYETSNGIYGAARGVVKNPNSDNAAQEVTGEYSHTGPDGVKYQVTYTADENGYQPQGAHLPVPPPVPEAILRAVEYIRTHAVADEKYVNRAAPVAAAPVSAFASASAFNNKPFGKPSRRF